MESRLLFRLFNIKDMARRITPKEASVPEEVQGTEAALNTEEAPVLTAEEAKEDIPAYVEKVLKCHPDQEELYVDPKGGAYTKGTQPNLRGDAILYKNPFYKTNL